jgi:hypothetical protein
MPQKRKSMHLLKAPDPALAVPYVSTLTMYLGERVLLATGSRTRPVHAVYSCVPVSGIPAHGGTMP